MKNNIIIITAKRGGWFKEYFTPGSWQRMLGEGLIGDYKSKMEVLREVDDQIYDWARDLKNIVKQMRKALNANRLVDFALWIGELNLRLSNIKNESGKVEQIAEDALRQFEQETEFYADDGMVSEAGWLSDFKRNWVAKKFQTEQRKQRAKELAGILSAAEKVVNKVMDSVDALGDARSEGDIGKYTSVLKSISNEQDKFVNFFLPIYNKHLKSMVDEVVQDKTQHYEFSQRAEQALETARVQEDAEEAKSEEVSKSVPVEAPISVESPAVEHDPSKFVGMHGFPESKPENFVGPDTSEWGAPSNKEEELLTINPLEPSEPKRKRKYTRKSKTKPVEVNPSAFVGVNDKLPESDLTVNESDIVVESPALETPSEFQSYVSDWEKGPTTWEDGGKTMTEQQWQAKQRAGEKAKETMRAKKNKLIVDEISPEGLGEMPEVKKPEAATIEAELTNALLKKAHEDFINSLKYASHDPYLMAVMMIKYAERIEDLDLEASDKLVALAEEIING